MREVFLNNRFARGPTNALAQYYLGLSARDLGDAAAAIAAFEASVKLQPSNESAQKQLGLLLQRAGRTDESAQRFSREAKTAAAG